MDRVLASEASCSGSTPLEVILPYCLSHKVQNFYQIFIKKRYLPFLVNWSLRVKYHRFKIKYTPCKPENN
jgi:hypothetical protein